MTTRDPDEVLTYRDDLGFRVRSTEIPVNAKEWHRVQNEVRALRAEVAHLREQRDWLQATGTRLVEENRRLRAEVAARMVAGQSGEAA